jgi:hypothetical protein
MLRNTKSSVCSAARVYSSARRSYSCVRVGTAWLAFTRMKPDTLHRREALPLCRRALLRGSPAGVAQTLILGHAGDLLFDARSPCCSVANAGIATLEGPALMKVRCSSSLAEDSFAIVCVTAPTLVTKSLCCAPVSNRVLRSATWLRNDRLAIFVMRRIVEALKRHPAVYDAVRHQLYSRLRSLNRRRIFRDAFQNNLWD